jgi:hypothetical protein
MYFRVTVVIEIFQGDSSDRQIFQDDSSDRQIFQGDSSDREIFQGDSSDRRRYLPAAELKFGKNYTKQFLQCKPTNAHIL